MPSKLIENKDLKVLQREYRNMEVNRRAFAEESHLVSSICLRHNQDIIRIRTRKESIVFEIVTIQMNANLSQKQKGIEEAAANSRKITF